ncbi:excinuclease ABC subunit A [bacterium]|nr:excinuclease ABC subunit A [bacterium]
MGRFCPAIRLLPASKAPFSVSTSHESPPIVVRGARTHNLKSVNCTIPSGRMTVITGLSGSGKSSLAFDTLFAEGQRRYVESLSTYARQFVARLPRPDVDAIESIPPAIALEQKNSVKNARSTIGTATEINDYLRLLFARAGRIICPTTGQEVKRDSPDGIVRRLLDTMDGARLTVVAPIALQKKNMLKPTLGELQRQGFTRLLIDGEVVEIDQPDFKAPKNLDVLPVIVDRIAVRAEDRSRLADAVETAYRIGNRHCRIVPRDGDVLEFSESLRCVGCPGGCGHSFREPSPQLVNFSSPLGACETCQGFGRVTGLDWNKIIPDERLTLAEGAVAPWNGEAGQECLSDLWSHAPLLKIRMTVPWKDLTDRERKLVRDGEGKWYGINGFFRWLEERRYKVQARVQIARYRGYTMCPDCQGRRLRPEAVAIKLGGLSIGELCDFPVERLIPWFDELKLSESEAHLAERPLSEVRARLRYLSEVGLGYLTLSRQTRTLSGGESQRINLSTALGSALTDTLYVLDEPTVGLHPRDTERLVGVLEHLRDLGNTVVIVEHDPDVMRRANHLIDIGPMAGERGGQILYEGTLSGLLKSKIESKTRAYLEQEAASVRASSKKGGVSKYGRQEPEGWIAVVGASENNLKHVTVKIPLGVMCCVTGVSGSGKSTLIKSCLYANYLHQAKGEANDEVGRIEALDDLHLIDDMLMVDQSPIGRSSRSNAATYLKAYDAIRELMANSSDGEALGLQPRDFSFNVAGGRCDVCEGTGRQVIDMHFLADIEVVCEACEGRRFKDHILTVQWNGHTIESILSLTVDQAVEVFRDHQRVLNGLVPLQRVGLGYLRLGQSTATLSGGEAQRLKLAAHIAEAGTRARRTMLLFDEPSTGLHPADLDVLMRVFRQLTDEGFSLVVIEHNLQLIRQADYVIDMGPEGGERGGMVVCTGTPEEIAAHPLSITGRYLRSTHPTMKDGNA